MTSPSETEKPERSKSVGIWIRVSTEDQAKGESSEHHEKRARYYAESKGWRVAEVYNLEAVSGKSVMGHPETERMLRDVRSGRVSALIFSKLARLARNTRELLEFADIFRQHNADLVSLQESIDTSTPPGRFFYTVIAAMAEWEREEIAERVAASVPIRAKLGKPLGGAASFGYRWENRQLVPDPEEAPIRKLLYDLFLEHRRKKTVARLLNDMGHRTRNGSKWSDTTIERLLRDPTAKGLRRANYTRTQGENKQWILKPEEDWVWLPVQPILSEDLWQRCNALLDERQNGKRPAKKPKHLFTGVVFCHCGQKMYVPSNTPKYVCYKCRNKIPLVDLEGIFQQQLRSFFLSPTEISGYLEQADQTLKEKNELLETLEREKRETRQAMDKVMRLYLDDQISKEGFGIEYGPLETRFKQLEEEVPRLQGEIDFLKIQHLASDQILQEAQDLYSRWSTLEQDEKRKIVENVVERITVGQDDLTINLCYLPSTSEIVAEKQRGLIPALPFCQAELTAKRPLPPKYPKEIKGLGDHIRKRRLDLGLFQKQVAELIGVNVSTLTGWERQRRHPALPCLPAIICFLGYNPLPEAETLAQKLMRYRLSRGISQEALARTFGINESTLARWERGDRMPIGLYRKLVEKMFDDPGDS